MENSQIDPPTDAKGDAVADRLAELGDYVRDLRREVETGTNSLKLEDAASDVFLGSMRAEVATEYQNAIQSLTDAIEEQLQFCRTRQNRIAAGIMCGAIEAIIERDAGER